MRWIYLIGAPKAGTTSVAAYLSSHPEVCPGRDKEPNYLSGVSARPGSGTRGVATWTEYQSNYTHCPKGQSRLDASTSYLYYDSALDKISSHSPKAKILVVLREPVSRAYSHYLMDREVLGQENRDFRSAMDPSYHSRNGFHGLPVNPYIFASTYAPRVEYVLRLFRPDSVKIMIFEDLIASPTEGLISLCRFLDLDSSRSALELPESNAFRSLRFRSLGRIGRSWLRPVREVLPSWLSDAAKSLMLRRNGPRPQLSPKLRAELYHSYFERDVGLLAARLDVSLDTWRSIYRQCR